MTGTFAGKRYEITARVVMGVEEEGETYYWDEFYLSDGSDKLVTLVCEQGVQSQEWRMFTEFEMSPTMTARAAALVREGDPFQIDGVAGRVTLIGESRVYEVEGRAPAWLTRGDTAKYFNVEARGKMWVVSWTGDEVECYRGMDLHFTAVAQAFGLPVASFVSMTTRGESGVKRWALGGMAAAVGVVVAAGFFRGCQATPKYTTTAAPPSRANAPVPPAMAFVETHLPAASPAETLGVGDVVKIDGRTYRIAGKQAASFARVNAKWISTVLRLTDEAGATSVAFLKLFPDSANWHHFAPEPTAAGSLSPNEAGARRLGDVISAGDFSGRVSEMVMSKSVSVRGAAPLAVFDEGATYHFLARGDAGVLLASWNGEKIEFFRGKVVVRHEP
jgi:hypothetical protein